MTTQPLSALRMLLSRHTKRREFITLLGGAAGAWPIAARAQQSERVRRVGVLVPLAADDPQSQRRITAFVQGLEAAGWTDGRNIRIDIRWTAGDADRMRRHAAELVALAPDVILASGGTVVGALLEASRSIPIVFTLTVDPVGGGFVASLARRGATSPDLPDTSTASARNGWSCSKRSHRA
jgi:putative tryptophan/tyrosine transport system substrate-binding protein